jgi:ketosteroid isomerase-like protein
MRTLLFISMCIFVISCDTKKTDNLPDTKQEIAKAESDFEKMAADKGVEEAFFHFADSTAVIKRENDTLISGRENIKHYYAADFYKTAKVNWSPDFIDVSSGGDMAYTYGKYTWQFKDSAGHVSEYKGVFHTVWKRQVDGSWKYVWD